MDDIHKKHFDDRTMNILKSFVSLRKWTEKDFLIMKKIISDSLEISFLEGMIEANQRTIDLVRKVEK